MIAEQYRGLMNRGTKVSDRNQIQNASIDDRWCWLAMVDRLSKGDITKHERIYELNYIECLNLLSYWNERDRYYEEINKHK